MTINSRIRQIRNTLNLTQTVFGERIGVSQNHLTGLETGKRNVSERIEKLICSEFNVNETWLRTGEGEMFNDDEKSFIQQLSEQYHLDAVGEHMLRVFLSLTPSARSAVQDFTVQCAAGIAPTQPAEQPDPIEAEVQAYRQELEAEAKGAAKSEVFDTGSTNTKTS